MAVISVERSAGIMPEAGGPVQAFLGTGPRRPAGIAGQRPAVSSMPTSDRVELPGHVVGDAPEIAGIGLSDERVSSPLVPPIEQIDILPASKGGRQIGLFRRADNQAQRSDRLIVGRVDELRCGPAI